MDIQARIQRPFQFRGGALGPLSNDGPLDRALAFSQRNGLLPVWAEDTPTAAGGDKFFTVASVDAQLDYLRACEPPDRCCYEVLLPEVPSRLHIDLDADLALNPELDVEKLISVLLAVLCGFLQTELGV
jgi:hypothetical protein